MVLNLLLVTSISGNGQLALVGLAPTSPLSGVLQLVDSDLYRTSIMLCHALLAQLPFRVILHRCL